MPIDVTKYLHCLDDLDMPQDQKLSFLCALWGFGERVMDLICGTDPTQLALGLSPVRNSHLPGDQLDSPDTSQHDFNEAAKDNKPARKDTP
jgi:hypothetical protein